MELAHGGRGHPSPFERHRSYNGGGGGGGGRGGVSRHSNYRGSLLNWFYLCRTLGAALFMHLHSKTYVMRYSEGDWSALICIMARPEGSAEPCVSMIFHLLFPFKLCTN